MNKKENIKVKMKDPLITHLKDLFFLAIGVLLPKKYI